MSKSSCVEHLAQSLRWAPGALLALALCLHTAGLWVLTPVRQLDAYWHDARLRAFASDRSDPRIAVVDIDEQSIEAVGRWPWSRGTLADLVQKLFAREGAALVGIDLILAEKEESAALKLMDSWASGFLADNPEFQSQWKQHRADLDGDSRLVDVLRRYPVITGVHGQQGRGASRNGTLPPAVVSEEFSQHVTTPELVRFDGYSGNFAALSVVSRGAGLLNVWIDHDGVRRRAPLVAQIEGTTYGSLALLMAFASKGCTAPKITSHKDGSLRVTACDGTPSKSIAPIDLGPYASVLMPYARRSGLAAVYSAVDVLQGRVPAGSLAGKLVLLGATAPGLGDLHATPVSEAFPGVQGHATLLSAILEGRVPHEPLTTPLTSTASVLAVYLVMSMILWRLQVLSAGAVTLVMVTAGPVGSAYAWMEHHTAVPVAAAAILALGMLAWRILYGQVLERRERRRIEALFGQYVPPELVAKMSLDPENHDMQGRSAELTVLFADLHGFTRISESMAPGELAMMMNHFFSAMTDVVRAFGGTLDKYIGDSVMAFWGAPLPDPDHALHTVQAAQAMCDRLPSLNAEFAARGWPALSLVIGINSGTMVVGDMGSRHRRAYTVLGDAVNVAARLQGLGSELGHTILIGQATQALLPQSYCTHLGTHKLRGRNMPVEVFTPMRTGTGC